VKIDPRYEGPVVWVKDASRSVPTAAALLHAEKRPALMASVKEDYDALRARHASRHDRPRLALDQARANRTPVDWTGFTPPAPKEPGVHVLEVYDVAELRDYIDWQPFFNAWEMKGKFPDILNSPATGEAARRLYDDAQEMLDRIVAERWLQPRGVYGFFPANGRGDDVVVCPTTSGPRNGSSCTTCASRASTATGSRTARWRTSWRLRRPASPTTSVPSR
jgi:5-methyltetrahydrofolate--homocysteine methyltransferase